MIHWQIGDYDCEICNVDLRKFGRHYSFCEIEEKRRKDINKTYSENNVICELCNGTGFDPEDNNVGCLMCSGAGEIEKEKRRQNENKQKS